MTAIQNLPFLVSPVAFKIFSFEIRFYSLAYLATFVAIFFLLKFRLNKETGFVELKEKLTSSQLAEEIIFWSFWGMFLGGRIGFVLFYDLNYFLQNPLEIFWPFKNGAFQGFYGLSFHGGLIGVIWAIFLLAKKYRLSFWRLADLIAPTVPIGIFLVRLGNFFNGELYGRVSTTPWAMRFPGDPKQSLRHPSQLYEALGEGLLLFLLLWFLRKKAFLKNKILGLFLVSYGLIRFFLEFFRQPDPQLGFVFSFLTMGQILCFLMILLGSGILLIHAKQKSRA